MTEFGEVAPSDRSAIQRYMESKDEAAAVITETVYALKKAHEWLERVEELRRPGSHFGLDHKIGENDEGCTFCHAVAAIEGRVQPMTEGDY